jgi:4-carboxymuconolactone decarboxylase
MSRLPDFDVSALNPAQLRVYQTLLAGPRRSADGPLRAWLLSPEFADRAQSLGLICRFGSSLAPRLSELAILVVAAHWKSEFEWCGHSQIALAAGLPSSIIEAVRVGEAPAFGEPDEAAVYAFARELLLRRAVTQATFEATVEHVGKVGVVDLTGILGYYTLIAMTIAVFDIPPPAGCLAAFGVTAP